MRILYSLVLSILFTACSEKAKQGSERQQAADTVREHKPSRQDNTVNPYSTVDISPMDMSYYPANYPQQKMSGNINTAPMARVIYSRPHLQGRKLFQDVLKYGEPWRLGANEATELELFRDVTIQGKKIRAGRYVLYCIPQEDSWTVKLNSNVDSWGLNPDLSKDIASFVVPVTKNNFHVEYFTIVFDGDDKAANLVMAWDNLEARLPISF